MNRPLKILAVGSLGIMLAIPSVEAMGIKFGLKAGLNMSNRYGADANSVEGESKKSLMGPTGGGFLILDPPGKLDFQIEVLYSAKGAIYENKALGRKITHKDSYLEIPVFLKYGIPTPGLVKPSLYVGPSVGVLLSAKYTLEIEGLPELPDCDMKDSTQSTDLGIAAGASILVRRFVLDVRYTAGMTTILRVGSETGGTADLKNCVLSVFLGVCF